MSGCTHTTERSVWVEDPYPGDDYYGEPAHWEYTTEHTTKDIGIGAYQCTQCNKVMYYTGSWRGFYENGVPCPSSTLVKADELARVRRAGQKGADHA